MNEFVFDGRVAEAALAATDKRPPWDAYFMLIAQAVAQRSSCLRRKVGAVIVDSQHRPISFGYNGAPRGKPSCLKVGCLDLGDGRCTRTIHAEMNAFAFARQSCEGATLYSTCLPCWRCYSFAIQSGISRIVYAEDYHGPEVSLVLDDATILVEQLA